MVKVAVPNPITLSAIEESVLLMSGVVPVAVSDPELKFGIFVLLYRPGAVIGEA
jgi:hypothetical protein